MHSRIAVNEVCLPAGLTIDQEIADWTRIGVDRVGLLNLRRAEDDWRPDVQAVLDTGIEVAYLTHARMYALDDPSSWDASSDALRASIDVAADLGIGTIYTTTGPKGRLTFEEAVDALADAYAPVREYAAGRGVTMLVETANQLFAHTHFLHTLADTTAVAKRTGMGVCLDVHAIWTESSLQPRLEAAAPLVGLVQISDFIPAQLTISRDVPGDGILPIESIVATMLDSGYSGLFDLELFRRPEETAVIDTDRGVRWLGDLLDRLGV